MVECDAALAVMGNHEFNAIAFHTVQHDDPNSYCRPHTPKNTAQHQETLDQLSADELNSALEWFRSLPVALDLGTLRVVHACWDSQGIDLLNGRLAGGDRFDTAFLTDACALGHPLGQAIDRVLKGPEASLPEGVRVADKDGHARRRVRIRWFDSPAGHSLGTYAFPAVAQLSHYDVPMDRQSLVYPSHAPPVFFGHYWLEDPVPVPLAHNVACLDYSVAKGGMLCAYRSDGEGRLSSDHFVTVSVAPQAPEQRR